MATTLSESQRNHYLDFYADALRSLATKKLRDLHMFRHCCDSWFAFSVGQPLVTSRDKENWRAKWLNRPKPTRGNLLCFDKMHYVSPNALKFIRDHLGDSKGASILVKDHAIPLEELYKMCTTENVDAVQVLTKYYKIGLITDCEHRNINLTNKSDMPQGWQTTPTPNLLARYEPLGSCAVTADRDAWDCLIESCPRAQRE